MGDRSNPNADAPGHRGRGFALSLCLLEVPGLTRYQGLEGGGRARVSGPGGDGGGGDALGMHRLGHVRHAFGTVPAGGGALASDALHSRPLYCHPRQPIPPKSETTRPWAQCPRPHVPGYAFMGHVQPPHCISVGPVFQGLFLLCAVACLWAMTPTVCSAHILHHTSHFRAY